MAGSILKIHTQNGDIPIGYPGLADKLYLIKHYLWTALSQMLK